MPKDIRYSPVFDLISHPRLSRFDIFFNDIEETDYRRYGIYLWSQYASAALYPLMQQLEVLLRNAIDREARQRFGEFWWDTIDVDETRDNWNNFKNGVANARRNMEKSWKKAEKTRLNLAHDKPLPESSKLPDFKHDEVIAATDFGTWKEIMITAYSTTERNKQERFLWPRSFSKVFRRFNLFNNSPERAREEILNTINELKDYRNRLFHHDCIWVKSRSTTSKNAIETIRHKINLIEKLITCISPATAQALQTWGMFSQARRVCSVHELALFIEPDATIEITDSPVKQIRDCIRESCTENKTTTLSLNGCSVGVYPLRLS